MATKTKICVTIWSSYFPNLVCSEKRTKAHGVMDTQNKISALPPLPLLPFNHTCAMHSLQDSPNKSVIDIAVTNSLRTHWLSSINLKYWARHVYGSIDHGHVAWLTVITFHVNSVFQTFENPPLYLGRIVDAIVCDLCSGWFRVKYVAIKTDLFFNSVYIFAFHWYVYLHFR